MEFMQPVAVTFEHSFQDEYPGWFDHVDCFGKFIIRKKKNRKKGVPVWSVNRHQVRPITESEMNNLIYKMENSR